MTKAGYPTHYLILDFETYFDAVYSIRNQSTIEHIMDPRFEALGLAIYDSDGGEAWYQGEGMIRTYLGCIQKMHGAGLGSVTIVAHNLTYDAAILAYRYGIYPDYMIDTLGLARAWNPRANNDLDKLVKRIIKQDSTSELQKHAGVLLAGKGDTKQFKELTLRRRWFTPKRKKGRKGLPMPEERPRATPAELEALKEYALQDVRLENAVLHHFLPLLSDPATELRACQHTVELFTKPSLRVDYDRADELVKQMDAEIDVVVSKAGYTRSEISGENSFEAIMVAAIEQAEDNPARYRKPAKNKQKWKLAIAKTDSEREILEQHEDEKIRNLMAAKAAITSWPGHIKRVHSICNQARANNGVLPVPLKYHGAHTGRWSGGQKINLQNLGSRGHPLVCAIRELLLAAVGYKLVIADAAQIEARVLAWLAGQDDLCDVFAKGGDVYCYMAEKIVGYACNKADHPDERQKGKVAVLGGGYGMGANKMSATYALPYDEAKQIIDAYRSGNDKIVKFWSDIEAAFVYTFTSKRSVELRGLRFDHVPGLCDVIITLPSGRELHYPDVQYDRKDKTLEVYNALTRSWGHVWGGHLTENVVQAISRCILWAAIQEVEDAGYPVALHVHDELIEHVPEDKAEAGLGAAIKALSTVPVWGEGLPLAAEGLITDRYGGH